MTFNVGKKRNIKGGLFLKLLYNTFFDNSNNNISQCPMISIFNSTTDYKGVVTTNCKNVRKKMEFSVQNTASL